MNYSLYKKLPHLLRKYRRASGYSQQQVAELLGVKSSSIISRWEKGLCIPNVINTFKLSVVYRVMADALFIDLLRTVRLEIKENEKKYLDEKRSGNK